LSVGILTTLYAVCAGYIQGTGAWRFWWYWNICSSGLCRFWHSCTQKFEISQCKI